jgi:hypothetical protein
MGSSQPFLFHKTPEFQWKSFPVKAKGFHLGDSIYAGIFIHSFYQNAPVHPAELYKDKFRFAIQPYFSIPFSKNVTFRFRFFLENKTNDLLDSNKLYYGHYFSNGQGDVEIASFRYQKGNFTLKFGRDYFQLYPSYFEPILFSNYQYSYDQIYLSYSYKKIKLSSFYIPLDQYRGFFRQLYGHVLDVRIMDNMTLKIFDLAIYDRNNREFNVSLLNPFLPFFIYQYNNQAGGNTVIGFRFHYKLTERLEYEQQFVLDDFQIEKKEPGDLEPTEFGISSTLFFRNIIPDFHWGINYTLISNRTYNVVIPAEKMVYRNLPINHFAGNNFWELKTSVSYQYRKSLFSKLTLYYREYGDEALYAPFNEDFLNYTVEEGYSEPFPFGTIHKQAGAWINLWYQLNRYLLFTIDASYWLEKGNLPERAAVRGGVSFIL